MPAKPGKKLQEVPGTLNEEFYQINLDIRNSFSKYRPPLSIFRFREEVGRLEPYYKVGDRLSNEQVAELEQLVVDGFAFVSRDDHQIYVKHIAHQLDLVLVDKNLKPGEIADIFIAALTMRIEQFMEQPVKAAWQRLEEDILVFTQYLSQDVFRIKGLCRRLHAKHTLANHSVNCGIFGLALFLMQQADDFAKGQLPRKTLDHVAAGLLLHDLGMSKIPIFVREKTKALSPDEQQKILQHPKIGYEMLIKLDMRFPEVEKCVLEHHERINGGGYPNRLKEADISYYGKLCALVDSFCAAITTRPYAPAKGVLEMANSLADDRRYDGKLARLMHTLIATKKLTVETVEHEPISSEGIKASSAG